MPLPKIEAQISQKKAILVIVITLLIAFLVIFSREQYLLQTPLENQWSVAFVSPGAVALSFQIDNRRGPGADFFWNMITSEGVAATGTVFIPAGSRAEIEPEQKMDTQKTLSGKIILELRDPAGHTRELYKVLP